MRITRMSRIAVLLALITLFLPLTACEQKTINQIKAEPDRYANHEVGIEGKVVRSYSVLGRGAYEVDDGTGRLWVVSEKGVPREGAKVAVKGKIRDGFNLGSIVKLPQDVASGMVMIESSHKAR
jgi:hypothetical protein